MKSTKFKINNLNYNFEIYFLSFIYLVFLLTSMVFISLNMFRIIMILVFIVSAYNLYLNLIAKVIVKEIYFEKNYIVIKTLNKKVNHNIDNIKGFRIKQYNIDDKIYLKFKENNKNYKYLVKISKFDNYNELIEKLIVIFKKLNPEKNIYNRSTLKWG